MTNNDAYYYILIIPFRLQSILKKSSYCSKRVHKVVDDY